MRYLDVCSGYSAATLAFAGFGWECAGYAEIDPFASGILAARHGATMPMRMPDPDGPIIGLTGKKLTDERKRRAVAIKGLRDYHWDDRIPNFGDFTTIQEADVGAIDLLIGGTPCQSFSQAGKRLGLDDPRGNLTLEFLALARRLRPRWLAWENVTGFLSHDEGRTPGTFFRILGELGYGWAYRVLDAQYIRVDGCERAVPQRRKRVIVVGCLGNPSAAAAVLFERESLRGDPRPSRRSQQDLAAAAQAGSGERVGVAAEGEDVFPLHETAPTLDASFARLQGCSGQDAGHGHAHLMVARQRGFGDYQMDDVAGTMKARDRLGRETDLVIEGDVAAPLRAGGPEAGWSNDLDNGTFIPVAPEVSAPLTSSRQTTDDGARTYVPEVASTLSAERSRSPCSDGSDATLIAVVPFDTTQITNPHNGSNPQVGDPCHALAAAGHPPAVAFKPSHYTRDKDGAPNEVAPPLTADTDKGDQDTVILVNEAPLAFPEYLGSTACVRGERDVAPTLESTNPTAVVVNEAVAFNAEQDPDVSGDIAGPLRSRSPQAQAICIHADAIGRDGKAKKDSPDAEGRMRKRDAGLGISEDVGFNLTTGQPHAIAFQERGRPEGRNLETSEEVAYALLAAGAGGGRTSESRICDGWRVRRLTPVECERLQGAPDHFTHLLMKKRQRSKVPPDVEAYWLAQRPDLDRGDMLFLCADSPRYRVLGNSYARNFVRWVAHGIAIVDRAVFE